MSIARIGKGLILSVSRNLRHLAVLLGMLRIPSAPRHIFSADGIGQ
ncbi:Uncharacterised protein [Halioglobus japonicus]|nr:Uncharacterised protein [Halioglobus japonicus]